MGKRKNGKHVSGNPASRAAAEARAEGAGWGTSVAARLDKREALAVIESTTKTMARIDRRRWYAVRDARADGANWGEIGAALKISRQAARQRFGPQLEGDQDPPASS